MSQPTKNQVHVNSVLTNISVAYVQSASSFIADRVFPTVPVSKQSDIYKIFTKADWFRDEAGTRGPATESVGSGYNLSDASYSCVVHAIHKDVADQDRANADAPLDLDRQAAEFVTQRLLLRRERQLFNDFFKTSVWGTDLTGVASGPSSSQFVQWNNASTSFPVEDIEKGKDIILSGTGFEANTLVLSSQVFRALKNHPQIVDRIKYTSSQTITADMLANIFDLDRVLVSKAVVNTAAEGATPTMAFVAGKGAWLGHVAPTPGLLTPSAGYSFAWTGVGGATGQTIGITNFELPQLKATRVEGEIAFDNKVVGSDLGVYFATAVA